MSQTVETLELVRVILDGNQSHQGMGFRLKPKPGDNPLQSQVLMVQMIKEHPQYTILIVDWNECVERWPFESTMTVPDPKR